MLRTDDHPELCRLEALLEEEASWGEDLGDVDGTALLHSFLHDASMAVRQGNDSSVLEMLIQSLPSPLRSALPSRVPWDRLYRLELPEARSRVVRLLLGGVSGEPPAFSDVDEAESFATDLVAAVGPEGRYLSNIRREGLPLPPPTEAPLPRVIDTAQGFGLFRVGHCVDEGIFFLSPARVGLIWFFGYD